MEAGIYGGHLFVDHEHSTGVVRGLLCTNCNTMLGHAKDNPDTLRAGIDYLAKHNTKSL